MPCAIMAGVSYSDYWEMTIGEIKRVVMRYSERSSTEAETKLKIAAFTAYNTACCVRTFQLTRPMRGATSFTVRAYRIT